jgi:membrane protein implicated in regulation of membrane protease activity
MADPVRKQWNRMPWWRKAVACCAQPTLIYSVTFAFVGGAFLIGGFYLDSDLASVGLILVLVAVAMLVLHLMLAYRAFGRADQGRGRPDG